MTILDTNVLSELMRSAPNPDVTSWISTQPATSLFTSTIVEAEIHFGIALLPDGDRKIRLQTEARAMFNEDFRGRILPFDRAAARAYAEIASSRREIGRPISQFDAQIAAISKSRNGRLATRNVNDFIGCGIEVINPWKV